MRTLSPDAIYYVDVTIRASPKETIQTRLHFHLDTDCTLVVCIVELTPTKSISRTRPIGVGP
jgi:hypothetical protein